MSTHHRSIPATRTVGYYRCDVCAVELPDEPPLQISDRGTRPSFGKILSDTLEFCEDCAGLVLATIKRERARVGYPEKKP